MVINRAVAFDVLPSLKRCEEKAGMQKVIGSRVGVERLAPVVVETDQSPIENDGQSIGYAYGDNIHNPKW